MELRRGRVRSRRDAAISIGNFDGLHLGHQYRVPPHANTMEPIACALSRRLARRMGPTSVHSQCRQIVSTRSAASSLVRQASHTNLPSHPARQPSEPLVSLLAQVNGSGFGCSGPRPVRAPVAACMSKKPVTLARRRFILTGCKLSSVELRGISQPHILMAISSDRLPISSLPPMAGWACRMRVRATAVDTHDQEGVLCD